MYFYFQYLRSGSGRVLKELYFLFLSVVKY